MSDRFPTTESSPPTRWPHALRAFQHRSFQIMYAGEAVSLVGIWMQQIAQSWLVYRLTGSSLLLGAVAFTGLIPILFLAPFGGVLADRYSRKNILIVSQSVWGLQALILAALTLTNTVQVWHVFVLAAVLGIVSAFDMPARQAFVVDLVGKEDLPNAIALNNSLINTATIAGPALAGLLVAKIGEGVCFFGNGISKVFVVVSLLFIKVRPTPRSSEKRSPLADILEGLRWARHTRPARAIFWLLAIIGLCGMPLTVLLPVFADRVLHHGSTGLGFLMGAFGVGALIGSVPLAFQRNAQGLTRWMTFGALGLGVSLALFASSRNFSLSVLLLVPVGFSLILLVNVSITLIQTMAPEQLRGRAMAVHLMILMGLAPFGSFLMGLSAQYAGAPLTLAGCGLGCLGGAALFAYQMRGLHGEADALVVAE